MISISAKEYLSLKTDELKLSFLEAGGVDNWEGYGYSLYPGGDEQSFSDALEDLEKSIKLEENSSE